MNLRWVESHELLTAANGILLEADVALDIGCGIRPQQLVPARLHLCIEPHLNYIEHVRKALPGPCPYFFLNGTWEEVFRLLPNKAVDTVFALDVIEHMDKATGGRFLDECERVARNQIVVFTPLGYMPQDYPDPAKPDRWGMDGGFWQTHRSGWDLKDFDDRWTLIASKDFHATGEDNKPLQAPHGAFWAIRTLREGKTIKVPKTGSARKESGFCRFVGLLRQRLPSPIYSALRAIWRSRKSLWK